MSLKKCLIISNAAIVFIPVLITVVASFIFLKIFNMFHIIFDDGEYGRIILFADIGKQGIKSEKTFIFILCVFFLSFLIVNAILLIILSKRILRPIERLRDMAIEISRGNLDFEVVEEGHGEIRELSSSFENMRIKLKESVHIQMKYDDDRKMLVSSISHDLKTPITSIKGYVEGIMDGVANTPEKVKKYLETIYLKAIQVDMMIDDLLLYSKLDLKQIPFDFERIDIVKYLEDCVIENGYDLEKFNIKVKLKNQLNEEVYVLIDRIRIKRVINNIIDNAKKYMDKSEGEILFNVREKHSNIIIEIKDNGPGIAKEELQYIFDRFYRSNFARNSGGSGLGLAIAKQIIEGHGGKIWAKSYINEGLSIIISLEKNNGVVK